MPAARVGTRTDLDRAKALLGAGEYTCVLCKGDFVHVSMRSGIAPMVGFLDAGTDLMGFSAADTIVGRAAAMLFVLAGVVAVHAGVMGRQAAEVLGRHGVEHSCDIFAETIVNRAGTGPCPMEDAVQGIDDPSAAFEAIKTRLAALAGRQLEPVGGAIR